MKKSCGEEDGGFGAEDGGGDGEEEDGLFLAGGGLG